MLTVAEGFTTFVDGLSDDLDIYLDHVVQKIEYDEQAVVVHCLANGCQNEIICGDYVLCTVPLGVLKETVQDRDNAPKFVPELPQWKVDAINALGFGNVNKILLIFEKAFWENTRVFGHISDAMCATNRGEMFMFQALSDKPVLIALVSGDSANAIEETPPNIIVFKIMSFLSAIFGSVCPKEPVDAIITYWRGDNFSRGAFSYVPPNCTPNAYDILAMPVKDISGCNRIFFAGEHTCRQHPASVHGAYLSGLREAGRLADQILGCPYGVQAVLEPE